MGQGFSRPRGYVSQAQRRDSGRWVRVFGCDYRHPSAGCTPAATLSRSAGEGLSTQRFQFVDEAGDDLEAFGPEGWVGGVEVEGGEEFLVAQRAAGAQEGEVAFGKALVGVFIGGVERVHQAIAEGIGVDIERRVDEMRDVGPVVAVGIVEA